jgi:L-seryl-tRNA(Ser) seleniumtransferase
VAGKKALIKPLLSHPLMRAIRLDKLSAAALEATVKIYLDKTAAEDIPAWRMMSATHAELGIRAKAIAQKLKTAGLAARVIDGKSMVGGGTLPEQGLPTALVSIKPKGSVEAFSRYLRLSDPPLVARIENDVVVIDMRTVFPEQDGTVIAIIEKIWRQKD